MSNIFKSHFMGAFAAITLTASAASAATITETFGLWDNSLTYGGQYDSITFGGDQGTDVVVTAGNYGLNLHSGSMPSTKVQYWGGYGLGAGTEGPAPDHAVDGDGGPEFLQFAFEQIVKVVNIEFGYGQGLFDLSGNSIGATSFDIGVQTNVDTSNTANNMGNIIKIGAFWEDSYFKVDSITVTYEEEEVSPVPLPASSLMLLGALGGLAAVRRKKS